MSRGISVWMACLVLLCAGASDALTFQAKNAAMRPFLSGGNLTANGRVGEYLRIGQDGVYQVLIRAYGSPSEKEWPQMALSVDGVSPNGVTLETVSVDAAQPKDYAFKVHLLKGIHLVGAAFLNDGWKWGEDRNLYLETIAVTPPDGAAEPTIATEAEWTQDAPARENATVQHAAEAIKKHRMARGAITVTDASGKPVSGANVSIEQTRHAFLFGANLCAFDSFHAKNLDDAYKQRFQDVFNYATLPFYWRLFEPAKGKPGYTLTDAMVKWSAEHGIVLKGHPLLYQHEAGVPPWSAAQPAEDAQKKHVTDIVAHYKERIAFWDVVNEPVNMPGIPLDLPHRWVRETDPAAKLVINEFGIFYEGYPKFFQFIEKTIKDKVPFDVVGIQAHAPDDWAFPLDSVQAILDRYAALGKDLHITEFFVCSNGKPVQGSPWRGTWDEAQQADYAEKFYRVCFGHPAVSAISWWDVTDVNAWKPGSGLLRSTLQPKPVYERLKKLIREEWWSKAEGQTNAGGNYEFTGFCGTYKVTVRLGSQSKEGELAISKDAPGTLTLALP